MSISNDLFLMILSMDSYNRGYDKGIQVQGQQNNPDGQIGLAKLFDDKGDQQARDSGFYAAAYTWGGKTVLSYRGTDDIETLSAANDIWSGWTLGAGYAGASQAGLAMDFYTGFEAQWNEKLR